MNKNFVTISRRSVTDLGECNDVGDQCRGNAQCELTTQGYGKCICPAETFGLPECLGNIFPLSFFFKVQ